MNYEELLAAKNDGKLYKTQLPIGEYYRQQENGKYCGWVDIRSDMNRSIVFSEALKKECERNRTLSNVHQLHFEPVEKKNEVVRLEMASGVYLSYEQLIKDNPAIVAEKDFIDRTLRELVDITTYLHQHGIYHLCYSPKTVFARKGDHAVMLLSHGSFYLAVNEQCELYGDDACYVAPEVLSHDTVDERSDVYSIGQFLKELFDRSSMPIAYKRVIKKATAAQPEERYQYPAEMLKVVQKRQNTLKTLLSMAAALLIALFCLALYFDMVPETSQVEFVKPAPKQPEDDLLDNGLTPAEMGIISDDSLTEEDIQALQDYQAKAEEIFKKRYEKEADRILSKIYNTEYMSNSEKQFRAQSQSVLKELMDIQQRMGDEANLQPERSQLLATEIIDRITEQKKKEWGDTNKYGIQK